MKISTANSLDMNYENIRITMEISSDYGKYEKRNFDILAHSHPLKYVYSDWKLWINSFHSRSSNFAATRSLEKIASSWILVLDQTMRTYFKNCNVLHSAWMQMFSNSHLLRVLWSKEAHFSTWFSREILKILSLQSTELKIKRFPSDIFLVPFITKSTILT